MAVTKQDFLKNVTILIDTREQKNSHIISELDKLNIRHEERKLDYGDYSFIVTKKNYIRDFSQTCVVERKANVDEIYSNIMHDRSRIEKELYAACLLCRQLTMIIENCGSWEELAAYKIPEWKMKTTPSRQVADIGKYVNATLMAWRIGNRYDFDVQFSKDPNNTAVQMLNIFYYYYHNYRELVASRR